MSKRVKESASVNFLLLCFLSFVFLLLLCETKPQRKEGVIGRKEWAGGGELQIACGALELEVLTK